MQTHSTQTLSKLTHSSQQTDTGRSCQCGWHHGAVPAAPSLTRCPEVSIRHRGPPSHHRTGQEPQSCCSRKPKPHGLRLYQLSSPSLPNRPRPVFKLKPPAVSEQSLCTEGLQPGNRSPAQPSSAGATHKAGSRARHQLRPLPRPPDGKASLTGGHPQPCDGRHSPARPAAPPQPLPRAERPAAPPRPAPPRPARCRLRLLPPSPPEVGDVPPAPRWGCGSPRDEERKH